jgi:hypothetical protein
MAIIVVIAADHTRELHFMPKLRQSVAGVPAVLAACLILFAASYWGTHAAIYGTEAQQADTTRPKTTHTYNPDHPHPAPGGAGSGAPPRK